MSARSTTASTPRTRKDMVRLDVMDGIGRGNGARAGLPVNSTNSSDWIASLRSGWPICVEGTCWQHILQTLACYRLIHPGSEWRLHRLWFAQSTMADLLGSDDALVLEECARATPPQDWAARFCRTPLRRDARPRRQSAPSARPMIKMRVPAEARPKLIRRAARRHAIV